MYKWVLAGVFGLALNVLGGLIVARAGSWNVWVLVCFGLSAMFFALGCGMLMQKKETASTSPSTAALSAPPAGKRDPTGAAAPTTDGKKSAKHAPENTKMVTDDEKPGMEMEVDGDDHAGHGGKGSPKGGVGGKGGSVEVIAPTGTRKMVVKGNQIAGNGGDANGGKGGDGGGIHIGAEPAPPGQNGTSIEIRPPDSKK